MGYFSLGYCFADFADFEFFQKMKFARNITKIFHSWNSIRVKHLSNYYHWNLIRVKNQGKNLKNKYGWQKVDSHAMMCVIFHEPSKIFRPRNQICAKNNPLKVVRPYNSPTVPISTQSRGVYCTCLVDSLVILEWQWMWAETHH